MTKTFTFQGVDGLNKALRKVSKVAAVELRDASVRIAGTVSGDARSRAAMRGGVAELVAPTIRGTRDRVPVIRMGSAKRLPPRNGYARSANNQTIGSVIWGAEFGGQRRPTTQQFSPWTGSGPGAGRFLYEAIRADQDVFVKEYNDALMDAIDKSAKTSGGH